MCSFVHYPPAVCSLAASLATRLNGPQPSTAKRVASDAAKGRFPPSPTANFDDEPTTDGDQPLPDWDDDWEDDEPDPEELDRRDRWALDPDDDDDPDSGDFWPEFDAEDE